MIIIVVVVDLFFCFNFYLFLVDFGSIEPGVEKIIGRQFFWTATI